MLLAIVFKWRNNLVKEVKNIFAPTAQRVLRCLLTEPGKERSILEISKIAGLSYAHTYWTIQTLVKLGFSRKTERYEIALMNPGELLARWASYHQYSSVNKFRPCYTEEKNIEKFEHKLIQAGKKSRLLYALTLHAGANLVAPFIRPVDIHLYVKPDEVEAWIKNLNLEQLEEGGNVYLVEPYDNGVFYGLQVRRGVNVVSNVQLYVDLYNYPARGREAAEHLRGEAINF